MECACSIALAQAALYLSVGRALQAAQTLKKFTDKAFADAMKAVMSGWTENDVKNLGNNTLMMNYHTHAWNKTIQGEPLCVLSR